MVVSSLPTMVRKNRDKSRPLPPAVQPSPELYLNRELSVLAFNERVLAMAARSSVPLAERLRYICIVSSNMSVSSQWDGTRRARYSTR